MFWGQSRYYYARDVVLFYDTPNNSIGPTRPKYFAGI